MVYVLSKAGQPLMPTKRHGKVRVLLKRKLATVVKRQPFTIQLCYDSDQYTQDVTLGVDSGYSYIGFSAVTDSQELVSGEAKLLSGQKDRLKEKRMYRTQRRARLRYRAPRFDNRKKETGWLTPSIQHKLDAHLRFISLLKGLLPITKTVVEVANFDIQKIKDANVQGEDYQNGEQKGTWNVREYVLHRDHHSCQNPDCKNKAAKPVLETHHLGYFKGDGSDRPENMIALCTQCHIPKNHKLGGFLYGWKPKLKGFREATFMAMVRWRLVNMLACDHTYGFDTKTKRINQGLHKSHSNDAFCIAGGIDQAREAPVVFEQVRRNNRSIEKFYDAKYIDTRTGERACGQELGSQRRSRNLSHAFENNRIFRGQKVSRGQRRIKRQRYFYQPKDLVRYSDKVCEVKGIQNKGAYIKLTGLPKPVKTSLVKPYAFRKGFCVAQ